MIVRILVFALLSLVWLPAANAIHPYQLPRAKRPEKIDVSAKAKSEGGAIAAEYATADGLVPLNQVHVWTLRLTNRKGEPLSGAEVVVSADMPEHLHGTTTKPQARETKTPGVYLIEGMNFHMPGWWEVTLDVTGGGTRDLVRFQLDLVGDGARCPYCDSIATSKKAREVKPTREYQ